MYDKVHGSWKYTAYGMPFPSQAGLVCGAACKQLTTLGRLRGLRPRKRRRLRSLAAAWPLPLPADPATWQSIAPAGSEAGCVYLAPRCALPAKEWME